jgi:hypothetical protein
MPIPYLAAAADSTISAFARLNMIPKEPAGGFDPRAETDFGKTIVFKQKHMDRDPIQSDWIKVKMP